MDYGRLLCVLAGCMFFVALIVNPILVFLCIRRNPYPLVFRCLKESGIMAFFTRSSAANIPVNLRLCKELGLDEEKYSVSPSPWEPPSTWLGPPSPSRSSPWPLPTPWASRWTFLPPSCSAW